jgi:hypothetical protein
MPLAIAGATGCLVACLGGSSEFFCWILLVESTIVIHSSS